MKSSLILGLLAFVSTTALAETTATASSQPVSKRTYIEVTAGQATALDGCDGLTSRSQCDDTDTGVRLAFGYQPLPQAFVEFGYINFGSTEFKMREDWLYIEVDAEAKVDAIYGMGGLLLPTRYAEFYGKAGFSLARVEITAKSPIRNGELDSRSFSALIGAGVHIPLGDNFGLVADATFLSGAGDEEETGESDMFIISAGPRIRF